MPKQQKRTSVNTHVNTNKRPTEETQESEAVKRQKFDKNEKSLEKIIRQTTALLAKMDKVILDQEEIKERLLNLEKGGANNDDDKLINTEFVKKIVKEIAKRLLEAYIYPSQDEMYEETVSYIKEEHPSFFGQFRRGVDGTRWKIYYEKNVASILLAKHRSYRGSLVSKIRDVMFATFREDRLPPINTNVKTSEVIHWKRNPIVMSCYKKLHKKIDSEGSETYISTILRNLWRGKTKRSKVQIAFAISICEFILNPENPSISISEEAIKPILEKNIKRVTKRENYLDETDYESTGSASSEVNINSNEGGRDNEGDHKDGYNEGGYCDSRDESNESNKDKYDDGSKDESVKDIYDEGEYGEVGDIHKDREYNKDVIRYSDSDDKDSEFRAALKELKVKYKRT